MKWKLLLSVSVLGCLAVPAGVGIHAQTPTFASGTVSDPGTLAGGTFHQPVRLAASDDRDALVFGWSGAHRNMYRRELVTPMLGQRTFADRGTRQVEGSASNRANRVVYVITGRSEFGALDLGSGTFLPIGPVPTDLGGGLVPGLGGSLLSLSFNGNLTAIDPATGRTSVVGRTGLVDCSTPSSPCGPNSANAIGRLDGTLYATDFANNLYSVDAATGLATLIGPTGKIPPIDFVPFSANADGTLNVYSESLFSVRGRLYATFGTAALDPETGMATDVIAGALYEIDRQTGEATLIGPTDTHLTSVVNVSDTVYAFDAATRQVVLLDIATGVIMPITDLDRSIGVIAGATAAHPVQLGRR